MQVDKKGASRKVFRNTVVAAIVGAGAFMFIQAGGPPNQVDSSTVRGLAADDAIVTVQGNGSRVLHVFVSADCGYCKKIEPELGQLRDVTIYRHLLPGHNAEGRKLALDVWCAADKGQAWQEVTRDRRIAVSKACDGAALDRNRDAALEMGLTATPSVITENGAVGSGMMSAGALELQLLQK